MSKRSEKSRYRYPFTVHREGTNRLGKLQGIGIMDDTLRCSDVDRQIIDKQGDQAVIHWKDRHEYSNVATLYPHQLQCTPCTKEFSEQGWGKSRRSRKRVFTERTEMGGCGGDRFETDIKFIRRERRVIAAAWFVESDCELWRLQKILWEGRVMAARWFVDSDCELWRLQNF